MEMGRWSSRRCAEKRHATAEKSARACGALEFTSAVCRVRSRLSQFCKLMCRNMKATDDEETLREAFKMLDKDGSGCIDKDELRDLLRNFSAAGEELWARRISRR